MCGGRRQRAIYLPVTCKGSRARRVLLCTYNTYMCSCQRRRHGGGPYAHRSGPLHGFGQTEPLEAKPCNGPPASLPSPLAHMALKLNTVWTGASHTLPLTTPVVFYLPVRSSKLGVCVQPGTERPPPQTAAQCWSRRPWAPRRYGRTTATWVRGCACAETHRHCRVRVRPTGRGCGRDHCLLPVCGSRCVVSSPLPTPNRIPFPSPL